MYWLLPRVSYAYQHLSVLHSVQHITTKQVLRELLRMNQNVLVVSDNVRGTDWYYYLIARRYSYLVGGIIPRQCFLTAVDYGLYSCSRSGRPMIPSCGIGKPIGITWNSVDCVESPTWMSSRTDPIVVPGVL